jgi:hypothetical protein
MPPMPEIHWHFELLPIPWQLLSQNNGVWISMRWSIADDGNGFIDNILPRLDVKICFDGVEYIYRPTPLHHVPKRDQFVLQRHNWLAELIWHGGVIFCILLPGQFTGCQSCCDATTCDCRRQQVLWWCWRINGSTLLRFLGVAKPLPPPPVDGGFTLMLAHNQERERRHGSQLVSRRWPRS